MTLPRTAAVAILQRRSARLGVLLATAMAIGAAAALTAGGDPSAAHRHAGPNAPDLVGPAAASGLG